MHPKARNVNVIKCGCCKKLLELIHAWAHVVVMDNFSSTIDFFVDLVGKEHMLWA